MRRRAPAAARHASDQPARRTATSGLPGVGSATAPRAVLPKGMHGRARWVLALAACLAVFVASSASATVVVALSLEELAVEADVIVHARVARTGSYLATYRGRLEPHTTSELAVHEWLKGVGGERVVVDELGGDVPGGRRWIAGTPRYAVGDEVVVFLRRLPEGRYRTLGLSQGRFEVRHAVGADLVGRTIVTRDTSELSFARWSDGEMIVGQAAPTSEVDYARFIGFVRSVLAQTEASGAERLR